MTDKKTLTDEEIKTVREEAIARIPGTLKGIKYAVNEAERKGDNAVQVPVKIMKQIFGLLSAQLGGNLLVRPFDFDPKDPLGFDVDPNDSVPGTDQDPKDAPSWDLDMKDT